MTGLAAPLYASDQASTPCRLRRASRAITARDTPSARRWTTRRSRSARSASSWSATASSRCPVSVSCPTLNPVPASRCSGRHDLGGGTLGAADPGGWVGP